MNLAQLQARLEGMLLSFDSQREEEQADMLGYPHMQNFLLLSNALVAVYQAQAIESLDQDVHGILRQIDGFGQHGFPVEDIHR